MNREEVSATKKFVLSHALYTKIMRSFALGNYKVLFVIIAILIVAIFIAGIWGYYALGSFALYTAWLPLQTLLVVFALFPLVISPYFITKNKLNANDFVQSRYEFTEKYFIHFKSNGNSSKRLYTSLAKVYFGNNFILLFENMSSVFIVPFSIFNCDEDREKVERYIRQKSEI
ncbi:MAG: hypothetical protein HRT35_08470 [Algicola sp.]|nr:hypothetical protein [Algicola sp.]